MKSEEGADNTVEPPLTNLIWACSLKSSFSHCIESQPRLQKMNGKKKEKGRFKCMKCSKCQIEINYNHSEKNKK